MLPGRDRTLARVSPSAPNPRLRRRIELAIRVAAPALDLLLAVADRLSAVISRGQKPEPPARMVYEGESAPRGLRPPVPDDLRPGHVPPGDAPAPQVRL